MSDDTRDQGCEKYSDELAELALGVLTGRERAQALSHVESCQRCAEELEQLSRVADTVLQVAPDVEPPLGFDVRLFEKMGISDVPARRHRFRPSHWVPAAVAVAAAAAALGLGLSLPSSSADGDGDDDGPAARARCRGRLGRLEAERHDGRTRRYLQRPQAVDVDDAGRLGGPRHG